MSVTLTQLLSRVRIFECTLDLKQVLQVVSHASPLKPVLAEVHLVESQMDLILVLARRGRIDTLKITKQVTTTSSPYSKNNNRTKSITQMYHNFIKRLKCI